MSYSKDVDLQGLPNVFCTEIFEFCRLEFIDNFTTKDIHDHDLTIPVAPKLDRQEKDDTVPHNA